MLKLLFRILPCSAVCLLLLTAVQSYTQTPTPPAQQSISQKIAADATKLDINTATAAQLESLSGIGNALAARIIAGRPYTAKNQLVRRGILTQDAYNAISDKIIAHRLKPTPAK
jgi:DNA uptake protein ComE-like DNA-binding protein